MAVGALDQPGPQEQGTVSPEEMVPQMQGEENPDLFPADKKETVKFVSTMVGMIYGDEEQLKKIVQSIVQAETVEDGIAQVVAMLTAKMLTSIRAKMGRDINMSFVDDIVLLLISEMYTILRAAGEINVEPNKSTLPGTLQQTMQILQEMLQRAMTAEAQGPPPEQGPPGPQGPPAQGPPQEPMQPQSALGV